jgi:tetratricopeptide (TPR) repeat protein
MPTCGRSARMFVLILCAFLHLWASTPLRAQRGAPSEPPRPRLDASADTNEAGAYYRLGGALLHTEPRRAAEAYYWASRLDPTRQDAVYARRIALLLQNPQRLVRYMDGDRQVVRSPDMRAADSLYLRSLMMNPFMLRGYDDLLLNGYAEEWARSIDSTTGSRNAGAVRYAIDSYMRRASPYMKALYAYTGRRFDDALRDYGVALRSSRNKAWLHAERAHIYFLTGRFAETEAEMNAAITESRKRDEKQIVHFYDSRALYEYSLGYVLHTAGRHDDAIEAYGRALQEDLSYYPAHHRTAAILLERGDTAAAIGFLALAAAVETVDAQTRLFYAVLLGLTGDALGAEAQLTLLIEREPYFARPYAELGHVLERLGRTEEAIAAYSAYLERAARSDPGRKAITMRLEKLRGAGVAGGGG